MPIITDWTKSILVHDYGGFADWACCVTELLAMKKNTWHNINIQIDDLPGILDMKLVITLNAS